MEDVKTDKREIIAELRSLKDKNSVLLSQISELFRKADEEKHQRDKENAAVKQLVTTIAETRKNLETITKQLEQLDKQLSSFKGISPAKISAEIQALEYSLQVNYSPSREKTISKKVKELSKQLKSFASVEPELKRAGEIRKTFKELKAKLTELVKELKTCSAKSEAHHQKMLSYLSEADKLGTSLPSSLSTLDQKRNVLQEIKQVEKIQHEKQRVEFLHEKQKSKVAHLQRMEEMKEKAKEIMERFKLGKPISFEELQVLQASGVEL